MACGIDDDLLFRILVQDRLRPADIVAEPALDAVLRVLDHHIGDCLGVGLVDRLSHPDAGIEPVVDLDRADLDAVAAAGAGIHIDIARVLADGDPEVPGFAFDSFHLGKGMDLDICMSLAHPPS